MKIIEKHHFSFLSMIVENKVSARIRLISMLCDHIFMTFIMMIIMLPSFMHDMFEEKSTIVKPMFNNTQTFLFSIGFAFYFCKDCFNGRSSAKIIFKLQVINNKTGNIASPLQCFVRNLFCILRPIEIFAVIGNPTRRIGDYVAGTRVIFYESEFGNQKPNYFQIIISFFIGLLFMFILLNKI